MLERAKNERSSQIGMYTSFSAVSKSRSARTGSFLSFLLCCLFLQSWSQSKKDSLWALWKNKANADTTRLVAIGHLCSNYYWNTDPDSAIILADMQHDYAVKKNIPNFIAVSLLKKAGAYSVKGDTKNSLHYTLQSLELFKKLDHKKGIATSLSNIGYDYISLGKYADAVHYFYEALRCFEKWSDKANQARTLANISHVYSVSGRIDSAVRVMEQSLRLCGEVGDDKGCVSALTRLASLYVTMKQPDKALLCQERAFERIKQVDDPVTISYSYFTMSEVCIQRSDFKKAREYTLKSLEMNRRIGNPLMMAECYLQLSQIEQKMRNTEASLAAARSGLEFAKQEGNRELTEQLALLLVNGYEKKGRYREALAMHRFYVEHRDTTDYTEVRNNLYQEQLKYDFEKKELLAKAEHEKKLAGMQAQAERKAFRSNIYLTVTLCLLFVLLLSAYFVYHHFRQKSIIVTQKNNILKQQLLVSQMSPHFVFNSLNAVQNFIFKQDHYNAGIYLKQFSELIRMILDFSRKDLITLEEEAGFVSRYLELQKLRFGDKFRYELVIDSTLDKEAVLIPPMLAQPFIENAIEHGIFYKNGEGILSIRVSHQDKTLLYEIEDNGIGLAEALRIRQHTGSQHQSLAIKIARERIEAMNIQNHSSYALEIRDKAASREDSTGVYVKFATPYITA